MDARRLTALGVASPPQEISVGDRLAAQLAHWVGFALFALVAAASLICCIRRVSGAFWQPLSASSLLLLAILLAAWAQGVRRFDLTTDIYSPPARWRRYAWLLPTPVLLLSAVSVSLPGTSAVGLFFFWLFLFAEEVVAWRQARPGVRFARAAIASPLAAARSILESAAADDTRSEETEIPTGDVIQQMIRRRESHGDESISGWLRADFARAQRTAIVHVAFCPPLSATPQFSAEQADGPEATIKATHVYPHGARVEVKLDAPASEPASVLFEFSAWESTVADEEP